MDQRYIRSISLGKTTRKNDYFFKLGAVRALMNNDIELNDTVTYFVGENGTGKSTLLEAIAVNFGFNPEGGTLNFSFSTYDSHSELYSLIKLTKGYLRPKDGFFLRAESFYNVSSYIEELDSDMYANALGAAPVKDSYGGISLHEQSHGESFFSLVMNRFGGKGLYILDEPEAALSPMRQMSMLARINELVKDDSQFIIATHSPILLAYPNAVIYELDENGMAKAEYERTQTYLNMKNFLDRPKKMINILFEEDNNGGTDDKNRY